MGYKVVPFVADVKANEGVNKAAQQLETLVNQQADEGWKYHGLETLQTLVTTPGTPGSSGCFGIGATPSVPSSTKHIQVYVAVFHK